MCADLLRIVTWVTPAQTVDQDGVYQPAYLNFDAQLLAPPHGEMQVCCGLPLAHLAHFWTYQHKNKLACTAATLMHQLTLSCPSFNAALNRAAPFMFD